MNYSATLRLESVEGGALRFESRDADGLRMTLDSGNDPLLLTPMKTLLISLAACEGMDVASILRKKRQQITAYELEIVGERAEEHPRRYTRITILHRVHGTDLSAAAIEDAIRLSETKYCSVHHTLDPSMEILSRYEIVPA